MNEFRLKVDKTVRYYANKIKVTIRSVRWDLSHPVADRPIFIVSGSRSGTQMLYKTLSESREIGTLQREIYAVWESLHQPADKNWATHALNAEDASLHDRETITRYFYAHTGKTRFVDKNNQHGLAVPYLHALFPDATFVYLKRSPGDTLNSMIEGWSKPERFAEWSKKLPDKIAIDGGAYTRWCFFLSEGWRDYRQASVEEVCAFQYRSIHAALLEAKKNIPASQWIDVFYEDIVNHPVVEIRNLFNQLDLAFDEPIESHTLNLLSKPYDSQFEIRLDKWLDSPHRTRIERVLPGLNDIAQAMGYPLNPS